MKHFLSILVFGCALALAAPPQKAPSKPRPKPAAVSIPAGAEKVEEGVWRARDSQGKSWLYKQTPFGLVRLPDEKPQSAPAEENAPCRVVKVDSGQAVFERDTPFGRRTWTRRLEELDTEETRALDEWKKKQ